MHSNNIVSLLYGIALFFKNSRFKSSKNLSSHVLLTFLVLLIKIESMYFVTCDMALKEESSLMNDGLSLRKTPGRRWISF